MSVMELVLTSSCDSLWSDLYPFSVFQIAFAIDTPDCPPSTCGGTNIRYPFRLEADPIRCGDDQYNLSCENNSTVLHLFNGGKYQVQAINYDNFTIRVVDTGVDKDDCSSIPSFPLTTNSFSFGDPYTLHNFTWESLPAENLGFIKCQNPVNSSVYMDTSPCINSSLGMYTYAYFGEMKGYDLRDGCSLEMMSVMLPRSLFGNYSFIEVHREMAFGFELSWYNIHCRNCSSRNCYLDSKENFHCIKTGFNYSWPLYVYRLFIGWCTYVLNICGGGDQLKLDIFRRIREQNFNWFGRLNCPIYVIYALGFAGIILTLRFLSGMPLVVAFLIYKWRRRHLSGYDTIEEFLQGQNNLMPIRYAYSDIKKMTGGFKELLGKGGFGSVYKGKLRSGQFAAIKMLEKSKANGQDFINEVATIGRIHHANVVRLIGFCSERSKHALVYEFMFNGSLDTHIFNPERSLSLSWEKLYEISLGVARGIEYLHRGCDIQILHFDIKPHNILLNENFTPKISDFGLAKLYPTRGSIASLTAARGTIGYMAPELFYKNIGRVSYKADVYSFGMLLLEMAGKRKTLKAPPSDAPEENLSQIYYPFWVYDKLSDGKLEIEDATDEENEIVRKMIITGLWCIQMEPSNRPPMNKVVEMLEGDLEDLQLPQRPLLYPATSMHYFLMLADYIRG
ncbi:LEAF RUST 10 DISEASE-RESISTANCEUS RECEPTOR-LIKE PROTEIN KINASE-like 2.2 isoform X3 [Euphorbia lathyris]|uniref:LEAF RUST 10 DISEASE-RESISTANCEUS RECEPTOR-LIKE PROTEIN KINASE-like 2.2 isoform X3 n=1 Tax=Euphorbia lathyris TaxID=212925 RepID=UPI0033130FA4